MIDTIRGWLDPKMLASLGYFALVAIVFAETGLLVGFFLPGDSLLVTAGLLAATQPELGLNIVMLNVLLIPTAIIGDATGYAIGRRMGKTLFQREDSRFFKKKHLLRTQAFYEKHGGKTIVMARFVPIVRTFAPVVAGIANMPYRSFATYNISGGIGWVTSMTCIGYFLGLSFPALTDHIELLALVIIFVSLIPVGIEYLNHRRAGQSASQATVEAAAGIGTEVK